MKTFALALALLATTPALAGDRSATTSAPAAPKPGLVDASTAAALVASGIRVLDVRTPAEYAAGHVPGAVNIPYDELGRRHAEVGPPSTPVLLYCRSGRRSGIATQVLRAQGFDRLYDLQVFDLWVGAGGQVRTGPSPQ